MSTLHCINLFFLHCSKTKERANVALRSFVGINKDDDEYEDDKSDSDLEQDAAEEGMQGPEVCAVSASKVLTTVHLTTWLHLSLSTHPLVPFIQLLTPSC
jgi:hypothetical protein